MTLTLLGCTAEVGDEPTQRSKSDATDSAKGAVVKAIEEVAGAYLDTKDEDESEAACRAETEPPAEIGVMLLHKVLIDAEVEPAVVAKVVQGTTQRRCLDYFFPYHTGSIRDVDGSRSIDNVVGGPGFEYNIKVEMSGPVGRPQAYGLTLDFCLAGSQGNLHFHRQLGHGHSLSCRINDRVFQAPGDHTAVPRQRYAKYCEAVKRWVQALDAEQSDSEWRERLESPPLQSTDP
ncbi:MAG: hypothetical protein ACPGUV_00085 [Polyangiales bacterium]